MGMIGGWMGQVAMLKQSRGAKTRQRRKSRKEDQTTHPPTHPPTATYVPPAPPSQTSVPGAVRPLSCGSTCVGTPAPPGH